MPHPGVLLTWYESPTRGATLRADDSHIAVPSGASRIVATSVTWSTVHGAALLVMVGGGLNSQRIP